MISEKLEKARAYEAQYDRFIGKEERPVFHLTPRIGWMNDPNGFGWYRGKYHLFYQYNPYETRWGPTHWGHAVSSDLLHWTYLPCALAPDQPYDDFGCFSGSAVELPDGRHLLLYTGVHQRTRSDGTQEDHQVQCAAVGNGLNYEKVPVNPAISADLLPSGGSFQDFRDPKLWREPDGTYACVVGNRTEDGSGSVLLFRSEDALHWRFDRVVDRSWNEFGRMWECPDFFPLGDRQVLLVSPQEMQASGLEFHNGNCTMCILGSTDPATGEFRREHIQAVDYGVDFYAPQTTLAPDGRRIMVAWMQSWDTAAPVLPRQRWLGQISLPRELDLREGKLVQNPIRELETCRGRRVSHQVTLTDETSLPGVYGRCTDVTVTVTPNAEEMYRVFRMKVAHGGQHYTLITYKPHTSVLCIDRSHSGFCRDVVHVRKCLVRSQQGKLKLRVILDRFSVEVFVNDGEQALSTAIYTPPTADGMTFEALQGQVRLEVEKYDLNF